MPKLQLGDIDITDIKRNAMEGIKWFKKASVASSSSKLPPQMDEEQKASYRSLLQSGSDTSSTRDEQEMTETLKPKKSRIHRYAVFTLKFLVVICAAWGVFTTSTKMYRRHAGPPSCSCGGTTVAEAERRGCIFTPMALGWLPPHCLDMELSDRFDKLGPGPSADRPWLKPGEWPYWADLNGTIRLTREEMGRLADKKGLFYTTQEWHIMHCMFTWRKQFRSRTNGKTVENRSNGIPHIHHCEGIMLDRAPLQAIWTMAGVELNADLT